MSDQSRVFIDCRDQPSDSNCSLRIAGTSDEVVEAARQHAISHHGHADSPELVTMIRGGLKAEAVVV
jgi:hypothetical protein